MILIVILASVPFLVSSSFLNDNCNNVQSSHRIINIGAMFPFAGSWPGGVSCYPAAQLALAHVNCHQSRAIIDGFKLNLIVTNTSVSSLIHFIAVTPHNAHRSILGSFHFGTISILAFQYFAPSVIVEGKVFA